MMKAKSSHNPNTAHQIHGPIQTRSTQTHITTIRRTHPIRSLFPRLNHIARHHNPQPRPVQKLLVTQVEPPHQVHES